MAVVINEMEIEPGASEASSGAPASGSKGGKKPLDQHEVERAIAKQMERSARVRAH